MDSTVRQTQNVSEFQIQAEIQIQSGTNIKNYQGFLEFLVIGGITRSENQILWDTSAQVPLVSRKREGPCGRLVGVLRSPIASLGRSEAPVPWHCPTLLYIVEGADSFVQHSRRPEDL